MTTTTNKACFAAMATGLAIALASSTGCTHFKSGFWNKLPGLDKLDESKYTQPKKMAVTWTDTVYSAAGAPPTRGFGGRIYFYDDKGTCVPVEGQLVVYAYDDSSADNVSRSPSRRFMFKPEQFSKHYSPSELGASYSVWLPWDALGGEQTSISLLPVFRSSAGQIVMGQQSVNILPGKEPSRPELAGDRLFGQRPGPAPPVPPAVRQVGYQQPLEQAPPAENLFQRPQNPWAAAQTGDSGKAPGAEMEAEKLRTATINLTPNLAQRFYASAGNAAVNSTQPHQANPQQAYGQVRGAATNAAQATQAPTVYSPSANPRSIRYVRPRLQAPVGPAAPPTADRPANVPFPGGRPSTPPISPSILQHQRPVGS